MTSKVGMSDTVADSLRNLGVRGVLLQMAQRGQIIELRCEMPKCYCHKGRAYFDPKSHPPGPWEPSPDHYPRLKSDGGHLDPWNVRLSHVLCNREDYAWRMRIRRMLEKGMSLDEIAEKLNDKGVGAPHGRGKMVGRHRAESVRLVTPRKGRRRRWAGARVRGFESRYGRAKLAMDRGAVIPIFVRLVRFSGPLNRPQPA